MEYSEKQLDEQIKQVALEYNIKGYARTRFNDLNKGLNRLQNFTAKDYANRLRAIAKDIEEVFNV